MFVFRYLRNLKSNNKITLQCKKILGVFNTIVYLIYFKIQCLACIYLPYPFFSVHL